MLLWSRLGRKVRLRSSNLSGVRIIFPCMLGFLTPTLQRLGGSHLRHYLLAAPLARAPRLFGKLHMPEHLRPSHFSLPSCFPCGFYYFRGFLPFGSTRLLRWLCLPLLGLLLARWGCRLLFSSIPLRLRAWLFNLCVYDDQGLHRRNLRFRSYWLLGRGGRTVLGNRLTRPLFLGWGTRLSGLLNPIRSDFASRTPLLSFRFSLWALGGWLFHFLLRGCGRCTLGRDCSIYWLSTAISSSFRCCRSLGLL